MGVHCHIILRQLLEEIYLCGNIREDLDSGLHHGRDLLQIHILGDHFLDVRLSHLIEFIHIHSFQVLAVHPF